MPFSYLYYCGFFKVSNTFPFFLYFMPAIWFELFMKHCAFCIPTALKNNLIFQKKVSTLWFPFFQLDNYLHRCQQLISDFIFVHIFMLDHVTCSCIGNSGNLQSLNLSELTMTTSMVTASGKCIINSDVAALQSGWDSIG